MGDQHSDYYTFEEAKAFNQSVDGNYVGIGVVQRTVSQGTMIIQIYQDTPAMEAGLQVGDIIAGVIFLFYRDESVCRSSWGAGKICTGASACFGVHKNI